MTTAKKETTTKAAKATKAPESTSEQVKLPEGVGTQNDKPAFGPAALPRTDQTGARDEDSGEDVKRLRKDKAVWGENNTATPAELLAEQRKIDADIAADEAKK